jgi:DNA-binding transcriptional MocR family regulator
MGQPMTPYDLSESNWCPVPNDIVERLMVTHLKPNESRVLWVLIRKTFGFRHLNSKSGKLRKKMDAIALSQFADAAQIHRANVRRALRGLKKRRIISVVSRGRGTTHTYGLNFAISQWVVESISTTVGKSTKSVVNVDSSVESISTTEVAKVKSTLTTTKEINKRKIKEKETSLREEPTADYRKRMQENCRDILLSLETRSNPKSGFCAGGAGSNGASHD